MEADSRGILRLERREPSSGGRSSVYEVEGDEMVGLGW
jgi:hypothetical protein